MISLAFALSQETDCLGEISFLQRTQADCSGLAWGPLGSTWQCLCPKNTMDINSTLRNLPSEFNQYWGKCFVFLVFIIMFLYSRKQLMKKNLSVLQ